MIPTTNKRPFTILVIDDDDVDRMRVERMLRQTPDWRVEIDTATDKASGLAAIRRKTYDCVLLDFRLPDGEGRELLRELHANEGDGPPIIMQTVLDHEETAMETLALGAQDYLVKGKFDVTTLRRSIRYAVQRDQLIKERNLLLRQLKEARTQVKTLEGLLSVCAWCRRIQNEEGEWQSVELYVQEHSQAQFTHGMCPDCYQKYGREFAEGPRVRPRT